jgi:phosphomannomutase
MMPIEIAAEKNLLVWLKEDYFCQYRQAINNQPSLTKQTEAHSAVSLSYTAMHGVGAKMAEQLLNDNGFTQVYSVPEQSMPDGTFPTVNFPNPEEPGAMDMVIALAKEHQADLACANDPDADRFAVAARIPNGDYQMLTGDQVGCLLAQYLLTHCGKANPLVGNTIVSSTLLEKIAESNKADYYQTLTGFKWLTNVAIDKKQDNKPFLFAYEEALGYAIGETVWDKDGLSALLAFVQLASELKGQNKTVWDQLELLYREYGVYLNSQRSIALDPQLPAIGDKLRNSPPSTIAGRKVQVIEDLKNLQRSFSDGKIEMIDLPSSDVLIYHLSDGARVIVRPSGTEPKLKCYYQIVESFGHDESFNSVLDKASESMSMLISEHQHSLI